MWSSIVSLLSGGLLGGVKDIVTAVGGNQQERDQQAAADQAALRQQFAAEFTSAERKGRWNSFVDGMNRLVRPLFTFGTVSLFGWCVVSPLDFATAMTSLGLVPEPLWMIMGVIVTFWFGDKTLSGWKATSVSAKSVQAVIGQIAQVQAMQATAAPVDSPTHPAPAAVAVAASEPTPTTDESPHPTPPRTTNWAIEQYMATRSNAA